MTIKPIVKTSSPGFHQVANLTFPAKLIGLSDFDTTGELLLDVPLTKSRFASAARSGTSRSRGRPRGSWPWKDSRDHWLPGGQQ
jgi:hypothetical protein